MGTGYTRADVSNNIADGNVINASDLDLEFDAVQSAFDAATGHTHDGTTGEGAPIEVTGPAQEYVSTGTELRPKANNTYDLGSASNQWKDLYVDGTANLDTVDIDAGSIDGTTIGAATPAAGTFTTATATTGNITTVNATTVDTTNIEVTNIKAKDGTAAGSIADSTGVVTLASSVLTTTDINGGTIDGVTIGGASAGAGTFTTATATTGNITTVNATTVDSTNVEVTNIKAKDGTASATIADSTGVMTIASSVLTTADINGGTIDGTVIGGSTPAAISGTTGSFSGNLTVDTNTLFVDAATNNVGIGTAGPVANLHISDGGAAGLEIFPAAVNGGPFLQAYDRVAGTYEQLTFDAFEYVWRTATSERMRITSTGSVGIGTTSPSAGLHIERDASAALRVENITNTSYVNSLFVDDAGNGLTITSYGSAYASGSLLNVGAGGVALTSSTDMAINAATGKTLRFGTANTERMRIDSSGNVGIGTTNPAAFTAKLVVAGGDVVVNDDTPQLYLRSNATANLGTIVFNNGLIFNDSGVNERLRITSTGSVGIGTSSPAALLHLESSSPIIQLEDTDAAGAYSQINGNGTGGRILLSADAGNTGSSSTIEFAVDGTERMRIDSSGNVLCGSDGGGDIGSSTKRFKDLYLSGGAYIGGTTSANLLDDYEEGTWTPTLLGGTTAGTYTYTTRQGHYTKIGDVVWVTCEIVLSGVTSAGSGNALVSGLPFTVISAALAGNLGPSPLYHFGVALSKDYSCCSPVGSGTSVIAISLGVDGTQTVPQVTDWSSAGDYFRFQLMYKTSA